MKTLVIDGKSHLLGRLASVCAKELLNGRKIVIIRCEKIEISGKHIKNKFRLLSRFKKRTNTNPKHGPFHFRSPSQIFWKGLRGMLPHKTKKGTKALLNIRLFEGIPNALRNIKKMNFASALRINRLFPGRKFSNLGEIASEIGWTQKKFIIEAQKIKKFSRKTTSKVFYEKNYYNRKNLESENNFNEIVSGYLKGINPVNFTEMNDSFGGEKKKNNILLPNKILALKRKDRVPKRITSNPEKREYLFLLIRMIYIWYINHLLFSFFGLYVSQNKKRVIKPLIRRTVSYQKLLI